jgi:hypothetical protein
MSDTQMDSEQSSTAADDLESNSWRKELETVQTNYRRSVEVRRETAQRAHAHGLSFAQIGEGLGRSASNAFMLVGKSLDARRKLLDEPCR